MIIIRLVATFVVALSFSLFIHDAVLAQVPEVEILELDKTVERGLKSGESHSYRLELTTGQFLHLEVEQKGIDVVLQLFDPTDKKIAKIDSPNGTQGPEPLFLIAETSGRFRVEVVSPAGNAPAGRYAIKLFGLRDATDRDQKKAAAERAHAEATAMQAKGTADSLRAAIIKFDEAKVLFHAIADTQREAAVLNDAGYVHNRLGQARQALQYYAEAQPLFRSIGDKRSEATILVNLGVLSNGLGETRQALTFFTESIPLARASGDKRLEAIALASMGTIYNSLGEQERALSAYTDSLPVLRSIGDKASEATVLSNIGKAYSDLGEHGQGLVFLNQALPILRTLGDKRTEAITLNNIGVAYDGLGDKHQALRFYEESLPLLKATGDKRSEAYTLNNMGAAYYRLGKLQSALDLYEQSLKILRSVGDRRGEGATLNNIGEAYFDLGRRELALTNLIDSLFVRRRVGDKRGEADTLDHISKAFAASSPRASVFFAKQSVNTFQELRSSINGLEKGVQQTFLRSIEGPYRNLADSLIAQGRLAEAQQTLNSFKDQQFFDFEQKEQIRSLTLSPREAETAKRFDQFLNNISSISSKADALQRTIVNRAPNEQEARQSQEIETELRSSKEAFTEFLKVKEVEFKSAPTDEYKVTAPDDLNEMQAALRQLSKETGQRTVAVYTLVGKDQFKALLITADSIQAISSPTTEGELNQKTLQFWKLLQSPYNDPRPIAKSLYRMVFAPIQSKLPRDTKTILWSMDGNLRYVPVAALHDGRGYLVERFQNVLFTRADRKRLVRDVARDWTGTGLGTGKAHTVQLLGKSIVFEPLNQVGLEMARIFKQSDPKGVFNGEVLLDDKFTRLGMIGALKQRRPLVHIASHFRFEPGDEARSFLLLGNGETMTLSEMKRERELFAGVELLTLSACQTASQRPDANGREIDALAELAQRLGAGSVLASLWDLSDNSTAEIMGSFYKNYASKHTSGGRLTKAEALRKAQLSLLRGQLKPVVAGSRRKSSDPVDKFVEISIDKVNLIPFKKPFAAPFAHPFYWSPFVLFGNWK